MNSAGYSVFDEPMRAREKWYPPASLILIIDINVIREFSTTLIMYWERNVKQ